MIHMTPADTGPTPLQWLMHEIERAPGQAISKERLRAILRSMVGQRIFVARRDVHTPEVQRIARALVDAGFAPADAVREMAARCGLGRTQARGYVVAALNERALQAIADRQMTLLEGADGAA